MEGMQGRQRQQQLGDTLVNTRAPVTRLPAGTRQDPGALGRRDKGEHSRLGCDSTHCACRPGRSRVGWPVQGCVPGAAPGRQGHPATALSSTQTRGRQALNKAAKRGRSSATNRRAGHLGEIHQQVVKGRAGHPERQVCCHPILLQVA